MSNKQHFHHSGAKAPVVHPRDLLSHVEAKKYCAALGLKYAIKCGRAFVDPIGCEMSVFIKACRSLHDLHDRLFLWGSGISRFLLIWRHRHVNRRIMLSRDEKLDAFLESWLRDAWCVYDDFYLIPNKQGVFFSFSHDDSISVQVLLRDATDHERQRGPIRKCKK